MEHLEIDEHALLEQVRLAVVERSPDLIAAFDRNGVVHWCNDAGLELLGFRRDEVVGRSIAEFLHPDDAERAIALALSDVDHIRGAHAGAPYRHRCADGSYTILDVGVTVLDDMLVAVGRRMHDHDLIDRVLARLSSGAAFERVVGLLPDFDLWRNPTSRCTVRCRLDDGGELVVGSSVAAELSGATPAPGSPWQVALTERREVVDPDLSTLPEALAATARAEGLTGCRVMAVDDPRGHEPALITVFVAAGGSPIEAHRYPLETIARILALVLQFHHHASELQHAATHDPLTGLLNRGGFFGVLADDAAPVHVTVLAVDLDRFKAVNDERGHAAGDEVLRQVAARLRSVVGSGPVVARLGGDEFAVVVTGNADVGAADALVMQIRDDLSRPIVLEGGPVHIDSSIGVAVDAGTGRDMDALLAEADAGLYRFKARSRRAPR